MIFSTSVSKVVITNLSTSLVVDVKKWSDAPNDDASSHYEVPFSNVVYIEQNDFRLKDSKDYKGLAPRKTVLLKYAFLIKCTEVVHYEDRTTVVEIHAEYDTDKKKTIPKASLTSFPLIICTLGMRFIQFFDNKLHICRDVKLPVGLRAPEFERHGYFVVDKDSTPEKLVFNRTVAMKDTYKPGSK
ncbi:glutamine--tRNA ligase-like protein [Tanacetum coccineum]|uniref:Glutamine--tRNA ligase-like protein n=1 Tax=Tanacetum coccineum TaxID=301880 RepID=A0ABQ5HAG0_9ASTR